MKFTPTCIYQVSNWRAWQESNYGPLLRSHLALRYLNLFIRCLVTYWFAMLVTICILFPLYTLGRTKGGLKTHLIRQYNPTLLYGSNIPTRKSS